MSEFELQHIVARLLQYLGSDIKPGGLVEFLQRDITKNESSVCSGTTSVEMQIQNLVQKIPNANCEPFLVKYNDLKEKNVDSLNSFIQLLHHMSSDPGLKELLKTKKQTKVQVKSQDITKDNLKKVISTLKEQVRITPSSTVSQLSSISNTSATLPAAEAPSVASWVQKRPSMSYDFSTHIPGKFTATVPDISQESILMEDLLNVLIGLPGIAGHI